MSIVDPELMLSVPPKLTAYQGFDALFHAVEGYMATIASPMGDMFALQAIEYIAKYLPRAVNNGDDLEARAYVALANTYSGFVETISCCTSEHSIEHALSAFHPSLPHGAGLIMISWAYHEAYAPSCPERYARVAAAMGQEASVDGFLNGLNKLKEACGVDKLKMSEFGITPDLFDEYAKTAFSTMGNLFELDRCKLTPADVVSILENPIPRNKLPGLSPAGNIPAGARDLAQPRHYQDERGAYDSDFLYTCGTAELFQSRGFSCRI